MSGSNQGNLTSIVDTISEIQLLASRIQEQKSAVVALDERRQKLREAERLLRKNKDQDPSTWICLGATTFLQFPTSTAMEMLSNDRKTIETTLKETEEDLKKRMDELLKMEGSKTLSDRGFDLEAVGDSDDE